MSLILSAPLITTVVGVSRKHGAKPDKEAVEDWNGESEIDYGGDEAEFEFDKFDDETILITYPVSLWWCDPEVDRGALEEAILEKLLLRREWVKSFACNG